MTKAKEPEALPAKAGDAADKAKPAVKAPSILDRIHTVTDLPQYNRIKLLLTGPSGSGKSEFCAKFKRPLFLLTERQAIPTIRAANPQARIFMVESLKDIDDAQAIAASPSLYKQCDALITDSLTDIQRILKDGLTAQQSKRQDVTDMDTWQVLIDKTARFARVVRDAVVHTVIVAVDQEETTMDGVSHRPGVSGKKLPNELAQYVNAAAFTKKELVAHEAPKRHSLVFDAGPLYLTKSMKGLRVMEPPEPLWLLQQVFGEAAPAEVLERVAIWEAQGEAGTIGGGEKAPMTDAAAFE